MHIFQHTHHINCGKFGTRHIIEAMNTHGHDVQVMLICGGLRLNNLYIKAHADITGMYYITLLNIILQHYVCIISLYYVVTS